MSLTVWLGEEWKCSAALVGLDLVLGVSIVRQCSLNRSFLSRRGQTTPQMFHEGSICFFHIFLNQVWQMSFDCCPVHFQLEVVTKCQIMTS